ncbi:MAG TPA: FtsX-like permease family protein [Tenuifilaceae bacterium]|nr:FtsX-like permease family protein [Tenuifilaceae bacterium]HPN22031.1 FtsX-like permease family protein [Tenuifilaceae bacterium]
MILSLSWRNIWRNKTRSLIVVATLAVGLLGGVMFMGLINGWVEQRMHDSIHNEIAHIQIHNPQYLLNEETQHYISDYPSIITTLDTMKSVVGYTGRIKVFAMAQSDRATSGIVVMGINPTEEATVSEISTKIVAGEFLENNHRVPSIVVGSTTAESLKLINYNLTVEKLDSIDESIIPVEVKDSLKQLLGQRFRSKVSFQKELKNILADNYDSHVDYILKYFAEYRLNSSVILTLQTPEGELHNQMFKVRGVYKTTNSAFDGRFAYVERGVLASTAGLQENQVHEVAVLCTGLDEGKTAAASLAPNFKLLSVRSWEQVSPEIAMYAEMGNFMGMIYIVIILFALAFGIVNTMMMSVLERIRELGMLMAIGMNKIRVFTMIMVESILLSLTGGAVGMAISAVILSILSKTGIDFGMWAEGLGALGCSSIIYPKTTVGNYVTITVLVIITGMVASLWPARRALKLKPVEALRHE